MAPRSRSGFTLTELLVVITIIGMLVALLMPALISARARARVAQCTNNQKELGSAIMQYEIAKQRLPGYANQILTPSGTYAKVSWIPVIFPFMGRTDLWEGGWRAGSAVTPRLAQVICPNGSPGSITPDTPLSYVVNVGQVVPADTAGSAIGVFRTLYTGTSIAATNSINMSNIKSPARRPLISERNYVIGSPTEARRSWSDLTTLASSYTVPAQLGFIWPWVNSPGTTTMPLNSNDILPAIHSGIVIVTFCDGHTESLADNADCYTFDNSAL